MATFRHARRHYGCTQRQIAAFGAVLVLSACDRGPGSSSPIQSNSASTSLAEDYSQQLEQWRRQQERSDQQLAAVDKQLQQSRHNLDNAAAINERFGELIVRWSAHADRLDELLKRWEKITEKVEQRRDPKENNASP